MLVRIEENISHVQLVMVDSGSVISPALSHSYSPRVYLPLVLSLCSASLSKGFVSGVPNRAYRIRHIIYNSTVIGPHSDASRVSSATVSHIVSLQRIEKAEC
jgi:hypothetical protein